MYRCMNAEETENVKSDDCPEKRMWSAVVMTAWNDYFELTEVPVPPIGDTKVAKSMRSQALTRNREHREAGQFLLEDFGPWARSRRDVCDLAGIDPDWLREKALKQVELRDARFTRVAGVGAGHLLSGMDC